MRILFDQGVPEPLRQLLKKHEIATAYEKGWSTLSNGDLLDAAERDGYRTFVTTDSNLKYHQNLRTRTIKIKIHHGDTGREKKSAAVAANGECKSGVQALAWRPNY